jgi:hypothetical protein
MNSPINIKKNYDYIDHMDRNQIIIYTEKKNRYIYRKYFPLVLFIKQHLG